MVLVDFKGQQFLYFVINNIRCNFILFISTLKYIGGLTIFQVSVFWNLRIINAIVMCVSVCMCMCVFAHSCTLAPMCWYICRKNLYVDFLDQYNCIYNKNSLSFVCCHQPLKGSCSFWVSGVLLDLFLPLW